MSSASRRTRVVDSQAPPSRSPFVLPVLLVLVAIGGFLATGLFGLWHAFRTAEKVAQSEAERAAADTARSLRAAFHRDGWLDVVPAEARFEIEACQLEIPPTVDWLELTEPGDLSAGLPQAERQLFEEARRAEFRDERPKDAAVLLDKTCRSPAVDRRQRQWLSLALAFNAHRRGDAATRDSLLDELLDEVQQDISVPASSPEEAPRPAKPPFQSVTCGLMLLCTHSRREIPEWIEDAFRTVSPTLGRATLERIASLSDERFPTRSRIDSRRSPVLSKRPSPTGTRCEPSRHSYRRFSATRPSSPGSSTAGSSSTFPLLRRTARGRSSISMRSPL